MTRRPLIRCTVLFFLGTLPLLLFSTSLGGENLTVTTVAGADQSPHWMDGPVAEARFISVGGLAVDGAGNIYVPHSHAVRKIASGQVTTLAGISVTYGSADGRGAAARFSYTRSAAVDSSGNVYVTDSYNNTVRKIAPDGTVTTLAGSAGNSGWANGTGSAARFSHPTGIDIDSSGNLYVADNFNHTIRKITPAGVVTTLAGQAGFSGSADGTGSAARFYWPEGVSLDGLGNLYVADWGNHTIRKVTTAGGVVTTLAGSAGNNGSTDATGSAARFRWPGGVLADGSGNVYVADTNNYTIRKIAPGAVVTTLAGVAMQRGCTDGTGSAARFAAPSGMAFDGSGDMIIGDSPNKTLRKVTTAGVVTTVAGSPGFNEGSNDGTGSKAQFYYPEGLAVDGAGNAYVADTANHTVRKVTPAGVVTTLAGLAKNGGSVDGTGSDARFFQPAGIAVDGSGNLYVGDTANHTVRKITPGGVVTTLAGTAGASGSADGTGADARFENPHGLAVDGSGNVYVADTKNHTIRKVTPAGVVTTLAGKAGNSGSADGTGADARFSSPEALAIDSSGDLYVADTNNYTVRKVTSAGVVTTLAGLPNVYGAEDGPGSDARFHYPRGITVDASGNVYVSSTAGNTIRKITPAGKVTTVAGLQSSYYRTNGTGGDARIYSPHGLAFHSGSIYAINTMFPAVHVLSPGIPDAATIDQGNAATGVQRQLEVANPTAVSWQWKMIRRPTGSTATLSSTIVRNPTFTPDLDDIYSFELEATDAGGGKSITRIDLVTTVSCHAPVATGQAAVADSVTPAAITLGATDADGGTLSYWIVSWPSHGTLSGMGASRSYLPDPGYTGADSFTFRAWDGLFSSNVATVTLTATAVNVPPVADDQDVAVTEDVPKAITLTASDGDGDALTWEVLSSPAHGVLSGTAPDLTYTPSGNYFGPDSFTFKVNDGTVDSNTATVSITVNSENDPPTISDVADTDTDEDTPKGPIAFTIGDVETLPGNLVLTKASSNTTLVPLANISFGGTGANRAVTIIPELNQHGTATITITVEDEGGLQASDSFVLTVNSVNDLPIISTFNPATPFFMQAGTSQVFEVSAHDDDGDLLSYAWEIDGVPTGDTTFDMTYSPTQADVGPHTIKVTVSDGNGGTDSHTWNVTVTTSIPAIARSTPTLSPSCNEGQDATAQTFEVWNAGGGTLNYTIGDDAGWLSCGPASGDSTGEHDTITVTYDTSGLAVGTHTATITIAAVGADNTPQTIAVTLTVTKKPGGGGGGGGCALASSTASSRDVLGWGLPYLLVAGCYVLSRLRQRRAARSEHGQR